MQNVPRPAQIALGVFVLVDIAIVFWMSFFGGLARTPLQELPLLYWVLLYSLPLLFLAIALFLNSDSASLAANVKSAFGSPKTDAAVQTILSLVTGIGALLMSLIFHLMQPPWGGNTALFAAIGCMLLITAFLYYRRYQFLKNIH